MSKETNAAPVAAPKVTLESLKQALAMGALAPEVVALLTAGPTTPKIESVIVAKSDYPRPDGTDAYMAVVSYGATGASKLNLSRSALKAVVANFQRIEAAYAKVCELEGAELPPKERTSRRGAARTERPARETVAF